MTSIAGGTKPKRRTARGKSDASLPCRSSSLARHTTYARSKVNRFPNITALAVAKKYPTDMPLNVRRFLMYDKNMPERLEIEVNHAT